jgi:hypothetical protein
MPSLVKLHLFVPGGLLGQWDPWYTDEAAISLGQVGHSCQLVEVPELVVCGTGTVIAHICSIHNSVILPVVLFWCLSGFPSHDIQDIFFHNCCA